MRRLFVSFALALAMIGPAAAGIIDSVTIDREWTNPWSRARARLFFTTTDEAGQENVVYLYVTLRLHEEAELRHGEVERWRVRGQIFEGTDGRHRVWVNVDPVVGYHDYPRLAGNVFTHSVVNHANADFGHDGRIQTGAPATIDQGDVDHSSLDAPVALRFRDFGFEANDSAPTEYAFAFYRRRLWGDEPVVARGVFPHQDAELQEVVIEKDGEYASQGTEWFRAGREYWVVVKVKRTGTPWYTDEFGYRFLGLFEWSNEEGPRLRTADAADLGDAPRAVREAFDRLHQ